ncbi:MAG: hypothetical protein U1E45_14650 [Geminicoccaceae bacterium]
MARPGYQPPSQGKTGQLFDTAFIIVLVYVALFLPLVLGLTGGQTYNIEVPDQTWAGLGQNATMQAQWEKLDFTPETAAPIITKRFDYTINPIWLAITIIVIVGYFVFLVRYSDREYRDVIAEKFDGPKRR